MNEIDKLLQEVTAEYQEQSETPQTEPTQQPPTQSIPAKPISPINIAVSPSTNTGVDDLVADLKQTYQEQDRQQEIAKQQEIKRQQQKRQATLEKSAKAWLKKLDPHSDEGLWFTEFAYAYDSQLAAAIDYLSAMQETKQKP